jgi:hypothetical protein
MQDIYFVIFSQLALPDLKRARLVCHEWNTVASCEHLWKNIFRKFEIPLESQQASLMSWNATVIRLPWNEIVKKQDPISASLLKLERLALSLFTKTVPLAELYFKKIEPFYHHLFQNCLPPDCPSEFPFYIPGHRPQYTIMRGMHFNGKPYPELAYFILTLRGESFVIDSSQLHDNRHFSLFMSCTEYVKIESDPVKEEALYSQFIELKLPKFFNQLTADPGSTSAINKVSRDLSSDAARIMP